MKSKTYLIGLMVCLAIGITTTLRAQSYIVTDLGNVKGMTSIEPAAINDQGQIAGTASAGELACAFRYYNRKMGDVGGDNTRGLGISPSGLVVGDFFQAYPLTTPGHAAIFRGGVPVDLGVLKGQLFSRANGINAIGQVVGYSGRDLDSSESRAFIWTAQTGMIDIGTLGGAHAQANAINDAGYITGTAQIPFKVGMPTHAFIYQPLSMTERFTEPMRDLGVLGGFSSYGMAINANNHVAGYSTINAFDGRVHAFLHNGSKMLDLGSLGANRWGSDSSTALGLNNSDQVVGFSYVQLGNVGIKQAAFLWSHGQMKNLNDMLEWNGNGYWIFSATSINDRGQIVACAYTAKTGSAVHAVLLTPVVP